MSDLKAIVEALIFASPEPVTLKTLVKLLDTEPKEDIVAAIEALKQDYDAPGRAADGRSGRRLPDRHAARAARVGAPAVPRAHDAEAVGRRRSRRWPSSPTSSRSRRRRSPRFAASTPPACVGTLIERKLIKIVGRKQVVGRPFLYGTTREFLDALRPERSVRPAEGRGHVRAARLRSARRRSASPRRRRRCRSRRRGRSRSAS